LLENNFVGARFYSLDGTEQGLISFVASESGVTMQSWVVGADNGPVGAYDEISLRGEISRGKATSGNITGILVLIIQPMRMNSNVSLVLQFSQDQKCALIFNLLKSKK
jgi:hypothetical protein